MADDRPYSPRRRAAIILSLAAACWGVILLPFWWFA